MAQKVAGPSKRRPCFDPSLVLMRSLVNKLALVAFLCQYCSWVFYVTIIQPNIVLVDSCITDAELIKRNNLKICTL